MNMRKDRGRFARRVVGVGCVLGCAALAALAPNAALPRLSSPKTSSAGSREDRGVAAAPRDLGWPRLYPRTAEILVQQPQVDSWEASAKLSMRVAVVRSGRPAAPRPIRRVVDPRRAP